MNDDSGNSLQPASPTRSIAEENIPSSGIKSRRKSIEEPPNKAAHRNECTYHHRQEGGHHHWHIAIACTPSIGNKHRCARDWFNWQVKQSAVPSIEGRRICGSDWDSLCFCASIPEAMGVEEGPWPASINQSRVKQRRPGWQTGRIYFWKRSVQLRTKHTRSNYLGHECVRPIRVQKNEWGGIGNHKRRTQTW